MKTELGGDRLGSGNQQEIAMRNYERSSHDLGYIWRSSMSSGTLVPFMSEVGLPGDSFDIKLDCDVKTLPTLGPLFGSYKVQLDVFQCPVRLYQGKLHMNMLNIGMDMSEVLLPQIKMDAKYTKDGGDNQQINSSAIYSYLNMRGLGRSIKEGGDVERFFNAIPLLGYWDIYKNYYANKQEERGYVVHNGETSNEWAVRSAVLNAETNVEDVFMNPVLFEIEGFLELEISCSWTNPQAAYGLPDLDGLTIDVGGTPTLLSSLFANIVLVGTSPIFTIVCRDYIGISGGKDVYEWTDTQIKNTIDRNLGGVQLVEFPLKNVDDIRMDILEAVRQPTAFEVNADTIAPYGLGLGKTEFGWYKTSSQEGLGIKTYQSDLFNNWISTEWIDGTNGINEVTAVSTVGDEFTIDALNLANKVYNMLNRIAISGGSYDDWLDAVYTHERAKSCENPMYMGSLIKELAFEEVVSTSDVTGQGGEQNPLGTLAGRGRLTSKDKGGKIKVKVDEPSYIIGIVSITPRVDYSQGNKWDVNLKSMNDLHKPALDEIGFQDLVTDQMAWFDTVQGVDGMQYKSAGKQPAWINYMTNVNQTRGSFAEEDNSMFMTLNRRYTEGAAGISDLTTYIDPAKYNGIFAETNLDSQNFWVQISNDIFARRKMSAKVIPNL